MPRMGFKSNGNQNVYVYLESADGGSSAVGMTSGDNNRLHITPSTSTNVSPSTGSPMMVLDPRTGNTLGEGDIVLLPKGSGGSGSVVIQSGTISQPGATAGVLMVGATAQGYYGSSNGTNGQVLIGGGSAPTWNTITAGSGITVTNGANSITIAANGSAVLETITGNSGTASPTAGNINIVTAHSTPLFVGGASTVTLDFAATTNLALGSALPALAGGAHNTAYGVTALQSITSGIENTCMGWDAGGSITTATDNTLIGYRAGVSIDGNFNTIVGALSGALIVGGAGGNTILGYDCADSLSTGFDNIVIGNSCANTYTGNESRNIVIDSVGVLGETNTLHIGDATGTGQKQLKAAFICGIDGVNVGSVATVVTESGNQLGTAVITAGSGITVTPGANTITIATSSSPIITLDGNSGSATGSTVTITTGAANANGTALFTGSGATLTQTFSDTNNNTGIGLNCLAVIGAGANSTAFGWNAGPSATGDGLCLMGSQAGNSLTTGHHNTGIGDAALFNLVSGQWNAALGTNAGLNYSGAESHNVSLNARNTTVIGENNTLRIGDGTGTGTQQLAKSFISGIDGVNVGSVAKVVTMAAGSTDQLGTATITAGTNISVVPTANTITINSTGAASFSWSVVSGTSQSAVINTGYFANNAGLVTITLAALASIGDTIRISGLGAGGWTIAQNAGQRINIGSTSTTTGVGGSLSSTARYDCVELVCCTANTLFNAVSSMGNLTIV